MRFFLCLFLFVPIVSCKVYERCELAKELKAVHQAPAHQLATWVCIAEHESEYKTFAVGHKGEKGSADHGLFQISDKYWCSENRKGCGLTCSELEDDDISNDFKCAQKIFKEHKILSGDGFNAWAVYKPHCKGSKSKKYLKNCFDDGTGLNTINSKQPPQEDSNTFGDFYLKDKKTEKNPIIAFEQKNIEKYPSIPNNVDSTSSSFSSQNNFQSKSTTTSSTNSFKNYKSTTVKSFFSNPAKLSQKTTSSSKNNYNNAPQAFNKGGFRFNSPAPTASFNSVSLNTRSSSTPNSFSSPFSSTTSNPRKFFSQNSITQSSSFNSFSSKPRNSFASTTSNPRNLLSHSSSFNSAAFNNRNLPQKPLTQSSSFSSFSSNNRNSFLHNSTPNLGNSLSKNSFTSTAPAISSFPANTGSFNNNLVTKSTTFRPLFVFNGQKWY